MMREAIPNGRQLRALRVLHGLKQSELAAAAGVARKTISRAENGATLLPSVRAAIERVLGVAASDTEEPK
jgi:transcriptional regulator with XRE-family HTH domain